MFLIFIYKIYCYTFNYFSSFLLDLVFNTVSRDLQCVVMIGIFKDYACMYRRSEDLRHELEQRRRDDSRYSGQGDNRHYDRSTDYRGDSDR